MELLNGKKIMGGGGDDRPYAVQQTLDKGYIIVGYTFSNNGDVSGNHGLVDYWVVKVDSTGNIQWEKTYGGNNVEIGYDIQQTLDSGYAMVGFTQSNNGDVSVNHGLTDCWVVKLDVSGTIQWEKSLGGSQSDLAYAILQTSDLSYVVVGQSSSSDGDVTGNNGGKDYWLTKLDTSGNLLWQKNYGGSGDDIAYDVKQTTDGGYMIAGTSNSTNGDVTGVNNGGIDAWIVKTDGLGTIEWEKLYGGSLNDDVRSVLQIANGDYVFAGSSSSGNGDIWVVDIDSLGIVKWQQVYGGSSLDYANYISQTNDNGFIVCGGSTSLDGDVTGNHGLNDFWVVKLNPVAGVGETSSGLASKIYPNPTFGIVYLKAEQESIIEIYTILGEQLITKKLKKGNNSIILNSLPNGVYLAKVTDGKEFYVQKIIINQ